MDKKNKIQLEQLEIKKLSYFLPPAINLIPPTTGWVKRPFDWAWNVTAADGKQIRDDQRQSVQEIEKEKPKVRITLKS